MARLYSSVDLTIDMYAVSFSLGGHFFRLRRRKPKVLLALAVILLI